MQILFLRHGTTIWNLQKKLQGQTDIPLCDTGKSQVLSWNLPVGIVQWYASPLIRSQQTAQLLGLNDYQICLNLTEMSWGSWEGKSIAELREQSPSTMAANEAKGIDMKPPGGESPRQVRQRVYQWLTSVPAQDYIGAITHKGVIRAALSLATGWNMKSDHSLKIRHNNGYLFNWESKKLVFTEEVKLS